MALQKDASFCLTSILLVPPLKPSLPVPPVFPCVLSIYPLQGETVLSIITLTLVIVPLIYLNGSINIFS